MSFVNLHAHSHYSLLDGFGTPEDIVLRAKELGYPAAALTDHGVTYGLIEFYDVAKREGIKPLLGCEMYVARRTRFDKDAKLDTKPYHLTVLARNNEGYQNLLKLTTQAHLEGFYYRPRVDYGLLKAHGGGLLALSGCLAGHLARAILSGNEEEIQEVIKNHIDIFGKENYFLEIQDHPLIENQGIVNARIKELAKEYGLPLVATNDSHYPRPEDSETHDILLCIQTGSTVNDPNRMRYTGDYSIRTFEDLSKAFADAPEALNNTLKIADMCNVELSFDNNLIPSFQTPQNEKADVYLRQLCEDGLKRRFDGKKIPKEYTERLKYELETVSKMGFETYFLIVSDFVRHAKSQNIVVGPGRGSAAGSIIAWSLDVTDLDPIHYGLFFERFLNPERVSMPDIDIDFADNRRDEVLDYVINKYGRANVAQIITFGTMAPRASVRDTGRALGYPYQEVDTLAKTVPPPVLGKNTPLKITTKDDPDLRHVYENDQRAKVLLDYAMKLEGTVRHVGTHACAVVIAENPLNEYTALQYGAGGGGEIVTQYSAKPLEELGLLKMDFLGLRNLTVIEKTIQFVERRHNEKIDIQNLPLDDKKTFELFQKADTTGVFQFESGGMKRYLKQLKPTVFEDIVAMGALYRPGPMEWIPTYIKGKHAPEKVNYLDKSFRSILENTYGVAVYQEQILQIARDFAGFSLGEADLLRKAVGKKIPTLLEEQREKFVEGAVKNGHKEKFANEVFEKVIEPFAGYGFNRAHAVCYGMIAYQTAYLKAHYPVEFMTALLCSDAENTDRVVLEVRECLEMGINVLPPSVNESEANFAVAANKEIRFGLLAIKGIGLGPVEEIVKVRESSGKFKDLEDFAARVPVKILNKKLLQALSLSGAIDDFGDRNQLSESYDEIVKHAKHIQESEENGQINLFAMMSEEDRHSQKLSLRPVAKITNMEKLNFEKEFLGLFISGHPLRGLKKYIKRKGNLIGELTDRNVGKTVKVVGLVSNLKKMLTKNGGYMATFLLEDPSGMITAILFPSQFSKFGNLLVDGAVIALSGKLDFRREQYQIACDALKVLGVETMIGNAREDGLYDPDDKSGIGVRLLDDILAEKQELEDAKLGESAEIEDFSLGDLNDDTPKESQMPPKDDCDAFLVKISDAADKELMEKLKEILLAHPGATPVDLQINGTKRIRLPFGVKADKKLHQAIDKALATVSPLH